jgi:hypothetical protein
VIGMSGRPQVETDGDPSTAAQLGHDGGADAARRTCDERYAFCHWLSSVMDFLLIF